MSPQEEVGRQEVLWLLGSLSAFYRLPFDASLVAQEFPPPYTLATFHEAARSLGLKTGAAPLPEDWRKLPLPAIGFLRLQPQHPDAPDLQITDLPAAEVAGWLKELIYVARETVNEFVARAAPSAAAEALFGGAIRRRGWDGATVTLCVD